MKPVLLAGTCLQCCVPDILRALQLDPWRGHRVCADSWNFSNLQHVKMPKSCRINRWINAAMSQIFRSCSVSRWCPLLHAVCRRRGLSDECCWGGFGRPDALRSPSHLASFSPPKHPRVLNRFWQCLTNKWERSSAELLTPSLPSSFASSSRRTCHMCSASVSPPEDIYGSWIGAPHTPPFSISLLSFAASVPKINSEAYQRERHCCAPLWVVCFLWVNSGS